ncbi:C4-dicarboxylate transporter/malic acid transport protein [Arthrobacter crystallopoietes BAB-32]|uniref:C4-dicarboxylate transporter/malic acid transport protein n=1 Tax=Arthrobacter crystallopoietes BAB-32 TaxID=1246476 RepID=N1UR81_9MICC|nr:C4-dicarboxylate transporter/malic acid transport protein [Arthrobacter crystallopoietes BAB-32]
MRERADGAVASLAPGYFALVMGSGIVSVALKIQGFDVASAVLLAVCAAGYVLILLLHLLRLLRHRVQLREEFHDPRRGFGFFTFVAGTNVLGIRLSMEGQIGWTSALLLLGFAAWLVLGYVVPWTAVLGRTSRPVVATANGTWFIWSVASQSCAVAAATLEPMLPLLRRELAVLAVFSWSVGIFLYAACGIFVALRMMLYKLRPEDLTPPYWVAMGAMAISVVAGARIVEMEDAPMVTATRGLVGGLSVVCWAFATWLIPPLVAAGWWRHFRHRVPLRYEATWWSIVFPVGMYGVACLTLGEADNLPIVGGIGAVWLWVACAVWLTAFAFMCRHLWHSVLLGR